MTDRRLGAGARWVTLALLFLTVAAVTLLALIPTSYRLDSSGGEVTCRAVVAPIVDAGLDTPGEVPYDVIDEWLIAASRDDDGVVSAEVRAAASTRADLLCAEARAGRLGAMVLAGVIGFALSGWAALTRRETTQVPATTTPHATKPDGAS